MGSQNQASGNLALEQKKVIVIEPAPKQEAVKLGWRHTAGSAPIPAIN